MRKGLAARLVEEGDHDVLQKRRALPVKSRSTSRSSLYKQRGC